MKDSVLGWYHQFNLDPVTNALATITIAVAVTLGTVLLYNVMTNDGEFAPLYGPTYDAPLMNTEDTVPVGGTVYTIQSIKCNSSDDDVSILSHVDWRRLDDGLTRFDFVEGSTIIPANDCQVVGALDGDPGYASPLDPRITEGTWRLEGQDCAKKGSQEHCLNWWTAPFEVVR